MFKKLSRSWDLTKESFNVLMLDKELMVFPVVSTIATLLLLASFFVPAVYLVPWSNLDENGAGIQVIGFVFLFAFYFIGSFVMMFCNTALLHCAKIRFEGGDPTVKDGFAAGFKHLTKIIYWSAISGTLGVVLATLEERLGFLGSLIRKLVGGAWLVITYFAVPVLIFEDVAPGEAIKRSKDVVQKMWGEAAVAHVGMKSVQSLVGFLGILVILGSAFLSFQVQTVGVLVAGFVTAVCIWVLSAIVFSCLGQIYRAALYIYATTNEPPRAFRRELLESAFS